MLAHSTLAQLLLLAVFQGSPRTTTPPPQPPTGPGGAEYAHAAVQKSVHGEGATQFWLFEPDRPRPESAPVVVFLHGLGGTNPRTYGAWIDHIVRRGNVVVYPRYQSGLIPRPKTFTGNTITSVRDAFAELESGDHVRAQLDRVATVGHSMGGILCANLSALAAENDLPLPRAVFAVQPGLTESDRIGEVIALEDLSKIAPGTLLVSLAGDADSITGDLDAKRIYRESTQIPTEDKDFVLVHSDRHGSPPLRAHHLSPLATDERYGEEASYADTAADLDYVDAIDYYALWKIFDALCDAAFDGENREFALGGTEAQRSMGNWSDGQAVHTLVVRDLEASSR